VSSLLTEVGTFISLFMVYFFIDVLYAKYIQMVQKNDAIWAANLSVLTFVLAGYGTIEIVKHFINIVPICLGAWLGTYITLRKRVCKKS
jgi:hypothetical protein